MVRYFFAWAPLVIVVATAVVLTIPYLAVIVFLFVVLAVLAALAWALVVLPYRLVRTIGHSVHNAGGATALAPVAAGVSTRGLSPTAVRKGAVS
jgi:hypothetical protein